MKYYITGKPRNNYRNSVRDPINPHISVPLGGTNSGELNLNVIQALDLVAGLVDAIQDFNKRADVAAALLRTDPGPCSEALHLSESEVEEHGGFPCGRRSCRRCS